MKTTRDSKNHLYVRIKNIRITFIPSKDRANDKDWSSSDVIRIQAYKDTASESLHRGIELPVPNSDAAEMAAKGIIQVYREGRSESNS